MVRLAGAAARVLGTAAVFLTAVSAGAALHLDAPAVRRAVMRQVDAALASTFAGRVIIERVGTLGASGAGGIDVTVEDPSGRPVIVLQGARARITTLATIASLVRGGEIVVELSDVAATRADVDLDADETGALRIARAFEPRSPSDGQPGRGARVVLSNAQVDHVRIHGQPSGSPPIDANVDDLVGSLHLGAGALAIDLTRATVAGVPVPGSARAIGTLAGHVAVPSPKGRTLGLQASWEGTVGKIAESATATLDGEDLDANLDTPSTAAEAVRALWPACPFTDTASLHVDAHGTLPKLAFRARAGVGTGKAEADGNVTLGAGVQATAHVTATAIDAHALAASAPPSNLAATADVSFSSPAGGASSGEVTMDFAGGTVAGVSIPGATIHGKGTFDTTEPSATSASATINVHEPGAPTSVTLHLAPKGQSFALAFEGRAVVARLEDAPRLGRVAKGQAAAALEGTLDLGSGRLDARGQVTAGELRIDGAWVHDATLVGQVNGPVGAPTFNASLDGGEVEIGPLRFANVHAESHGTPAGAPIEVWLHGRTTEIHASARAAVVPRPSVRDLVVTLDKDGRRAEARAALVSVGGGETRIDDAEIEGFGAPMHAALRQTPGALYVRAHSQHLDLVRIGALLGIKDASGRVALDVDALLRANGAQGRIQIDVHDASFEKLSGVEAHLAATLDGRHVAGTATAAIADVGSLDVRSTSLEIGGSDPPSWSYWKRAWGTADAKAHIDLAKLAARLPAGTLPFESQTGVVDLNVHVERDSMSDATPAVAVTAQTTGLVVGGTGREGPWRIEGVDATAHVLVDGDTGHTAIDAQLADRGGPLATLIATSDGVPYAAFFAGQDTLDVVSTMPFQAEVTLPARDVDTLPAALDTRGEKGLLEADLRWAGTPEKPNVDVTATLRKGHADVRLLALPVEMDLKGHYDGTHADASLHATARGRPVLDASAGVDVRAPDLLQSIRGAPAPWTASSQAKLVDFPLQSVGALDDRGIRGKVSGDFSVAGLHDDAHATLSMAVDGLKVGDLAYKGATVSAAIDGKGADASLRIDQDDGFAEAHAKVGAHWGAAFTPSLDASKPVDLSLVAKQYRLGLFAPFISSTVSEVDGRLTADAQLQIDPAAGTVHPQGTLSLQDGTFELASLGGGFHDVTGKVTLTPDGVVRVENVSARGMSGRVEAAATARIDGRGLSGLRGQIQVPQKEQLPVVFDDVQVGTFYGALSVDADRSADGRAVNVNVGVQSLHVSLPLAAGHDVQALGNIDGLQMSRRVTQRAATGPHDVAKSTAASGTAVEVTIDLGKDAEVKRGTSLDVVLEGRPTLSLAGGVRAGGQIRLPRGTIDVQGKEFTLENGTVTFVGDDPTNPQVALTAKWSAPDGTLVYADFLGPLKSGQVTLRSEPARSKNEIIALILFGTSDDATSAAANGNGAQGLSVVGGAAGGAATQPINRVLDSFGLAGGVSTKIDTSSTTPRPEVEVQIARDITLQVAWVLGVPPPGSNPDSTLVTLNWRFLRKWSLATTVGDAGTSIVDLIWQHRY
jgi:translocation and assembly module TamB